MFCLAVQSDLHLRIPFFWTGFFTAFLCYTASVLLILFCSPAVSLRLVLGLAFLFRLTLLWTPPTLSDDVYRYIWDGRVQLEGINPFLHPPNDSTLAHLRDEQYEEINHKQIPTIYPPLTQLIFRTVCMLHPSPEMMKVAFGIAEFGIVLILVPILRNRSRDPRLVLLYAWNPLPIIETAGNGHSDALGVMLTLVAVHALSTSRKNLGVMALAGAFLSKLIPVLALPLCWRLISRESNRLRDFWPILWFPALTFGGYALFLEARFQLFAGLSTYLDKWRFNDALFSIFYYLLKEPALEPDDAALLAAKQIFALLLAIVALWSGWKTADPFRALFFIMGTYLLLTPTLHPWYLLWILPLMPLFPNTAWLLLSGLVIFSYNALFRELDTGLWVEQTWVKWVEYGPFFLLMALHTFFRWNSAERAA